MFGNRCRTSTRRTVLLLLGVLVAIIFVYYVRMSPYVHLTKTGEKTINSKDIQNHGVPSHGLHLYRLAERLRSEGKPLLVTVINDAYIPFAHNWLCNTIHMSLHEQVLVIVTDNSSRHEIALRWPHIHVIALSGQNEFRGDQEYSHAGYVRIMVRRTEVLLEILKQNIEILMFDLDTFWLTNPIPECQKQVQGHDIAVIPVSDRKNVICGGFLYMKSTENMIKLWEKLTEKMKRLEEKIKTSADEKMISEADNDQVYISDLLAERYAGIRVKQLSLTDFPDGKWYRMSEAEKQKLKPQVIHNNWIIGNKAKIERAQKFHQWFWVAKSNQCDIDLVILTTRS